MSKHTEGPWRTGDMFHTIFGPPNGKPAPQVIAILVKGNQADARLIAAAPELLRACLDAKRRLQELSECCDHNIKAEVEVLDAAIAKATGNV